MIYKLAWKMQRYCGLPFEDIRSEAYMAFMKCCASFDGQSKFSSWCYFKVSCHLKHWLRQRARDRLVFYEEIKDEMMPPPSPTIALRNSLAEQLRDLSPEAQRLIEIIIEKAGPEPENPADLLREACTEFRFERGLDELQTRIVVHEIKQELAPKI